jgi:predicted AAA+ superfamily ATPase
MNILQETYIAAYLPPFVSSRRNEIKSSHKCFFLDNGLRNFALRQFNPLTHRTDRGALIENLVFTEFVKDNALQKEELFFWRTKGGAEVDFVLQGKSGFVPIEIKAGTARAGLLSRSFHNDKKTNKVKPSLWWACNPQSSVFSRLPFLPSTLPTFVYNQLPH